MVDGSIRGERLRPLGLCWSAALGRESRKLREPAGSLGAICDLWAWRKRSVRGLGWAGLAGLSPTKADSILDGVRIWELKVEDETDMGADVGRLPLRGVLVDEDQAPAAWKDLVEDCKYLARTRQGRSRTGLIERLRQLGYALKPDAPGSAGARSSAIGRYRQLVLRRGRTLDFLGLGASIPPLAVEDADARVRASGTTQHGDPGMSSVDLARGLRRRGRVLLTGLPGGGKSTAVRIVGGARRLAAPRRDPASPARAPP